MLMHHKITLKSKRGGGPELGSSQKFGGFPLLILQHLKLAILSLVNSLGFFRTITFNISAVAEVATSDSVCSLG